jgi:hypothetical protein
MKQLSRFVVTFGIRLKEEDFPFVCDAIENNREEAELAISCTASTLYDDDIRLAIDLLEKIWRKMAEKKDSVENRS